MRPPPLTDPVLPHKDQVVKGIAYAIAAFFLLTIMNGMAKFLSDTHHVVEIAFYRNLFAIIPFLIYIGATRKFYFLKTKKPKAILLRSFLGAISLVTTFTAFKALPMAEVTVLLFTTALIMPVLSFFILKERIGLYRWSAIIVGLGGVFIMAGPSGISSWVGVALALSAATMHACLGIILRYMKAESPVTVTFYFLLLSMILTGIFMPFYASVPTMQDWLLFIAIGISGALAQICLASAYKNAPASAIPPFSYTSLIWASGLDILLWNIVPGWPVFLGGFIIIASSLFLAHREKINERKEGP